MAVYWGVDIFLSSALVGDEWPTSGPCSLPPGNEPLQYPLDRSLGVPQSRFERYGEVKILDPTGTRTPTSSVVHPVASRYTDCATAA
jgi:hypothetical protein